MNKRAVITGIGVVAPGGIGTKAFWEMLTAGRTATRIIPLFDPTPFRSQVAAECDFDPGGGADAPGDPQDGPGGTVRRGQRTGGARRQRSRTGGCRPAPRRRDPGQRGRMPP